MGQTPISSGGQSYLAHAIKTLEFTSPTDHLSSESLANARLFDARRMRKAPVLNPNIASEPPLLRTGKECYRRRLLAEDEGIGIVKMCEPRRPFSFNFSFQN